MNNIKYLKILNLFWYQIFCFFMDVTEIINIINKLRENPIEYKKIINLSEIEDLYKENINEISLLITKQQKQNGFKIKEELNKIAKDYIYQILKNKDNDRDNIDLEEIAERYGIFEGYLIKYIDDESFDSKSFINKLLFDIIKEDKFRQKNLIIFDKNIKLIGIANLKKDDFNISVILFCSNFINYNELNNWFNIHLI